MIAPSGLQGYRQIVLAAPVVPAWFHGIHYTLVVIVPLAAVFCVIAFIPSDDVPISETPQRIAVRDARLRQSIGVATVQDLRRIETAHPSAAGGTVEASVIVIASLSAGAGLIHAAVTALHFREYWAYGTFFVFLSASQMLWAYLMARAPRRRLLVIGVIANAAVILLWIASRTVGLPIGPEPGAAEAVGWRDAFATFYEAAIVLTGWRVLAGGWPLGPRLSRKRAAGVVTAIVGVAALIAAVAGH